MIRHPNNQFYKMVVVVWLTLSVASVVLAAVTWVQLSRKTPAGAFREDLYFRLNVITVELPPPRARSGDLMCFAGHYLRHFAAQCGRRLDGFADETAASPRAHSWPGNLRELCNAIERAVIMARESKVSPANLPTEVRRTQEPGVSVIETATAQPGAAISLEKLEEFHIRRVLETTPSLAQAAETLGIDQATLYRKRKKLGLE